MNDDFRTLPDLAFHMNIALVESDNFLDDSESKTVAAAAAIPGSVRLVETLENAAQLFRRNTDSGIG